MSELDLKSAKSVKIESANGIWLKDNNGKEYIDAISSWWVNIHGHNHPYLNEALCKQALKFAHVMTANFTHEEQEKLAENLLRITKGLFKKVFFASDGSSAIESALKMAYQFFINNGQKKPLFVAFENGYHGETLGALAVGSDSIYKDAYRDILPKAIISPMPKNEDEAIKALRVIFETNENKICAVILEPLLQCAGGMKTHSQMFVQKVKDVANEFGAFLILDEIAVGFGRTGSFFAYEQTNITPDLLCLSKALGAGYLPISATLISKKVSDAFRGDISKAFLHSHSHAGNALACAVANAGLELFEKEDYLKTNKPKVKLMSELLADFKTHPNVLEVRQIGMVGAIETIASERITAKVFNLAMSKGVFLRPLGPVIYAMPPYCVSLDEIKLIFNAIRYCVDNI